MFAADIKPKWLTQRPAFDVQVVCRGYQSYGRTIKLETFYLEIHCFGSDCISGSEIKLET